jgi:hypothetical protein
MAFDPDRARRELAQLDAIDRPQTDSEQCRAQELAQNLRLVDTYGVDPGEIEG